MLNVREIPTEFVRDALGQSYCITDCRSALVHIRKSADLRHQYLADYLTHLEQQRAQDPHPDSLPILERAWEQLANSYRDAVISGVDSMLISLADDVHASILVEALRETVKRGIKASSVRRSSDLWNPFTCGDDRQGPTGKNLKYRDTLCSSLCKNYPGLATAFAVGEDPETQARQLIKKLYGTGELATGSGLEY